MKLLGGFSHVLLCCKCRYKQLPNLISRNVAMDAQRDVKGRCTYVVLYYHAKLCLGLLVFE